MKGLMFTNTEFKIRPISFGRPASAVPRLGLSFVPDGLAFVRACQIALSIASLAGFALAAHWYHESLFLDEQTAQYEQAVARQRESTKRFDDDMRQAGLSLTQEQIESTRREVAFANLLTKKHEFSWTEMLHHLEQGMPPGVSIQSVRLNFQSSAITLHGTVKSMHNLNSLTTRLNDEGSFTHVGLTDHMIRPSIQSIQSPRQNLGATGDSHRTSADLIDFTLTMTYRQKF